ncbi:hypothetical protein C8R47DRAFT_1081642 [Mycena vitilis]|nr:hypothetical protein C8R47DRAFT_1081642 [Mycena vitilis]
MGLARHCRGKTQPRASMRGNAASVRGSRAAVAAFSPSPTNTSYDAAMPSVHAHFAAGSSATGPSAPTAIVVPPSQYDILQQLARNRTLASLPREPVTKPRKIRTCRKCGIATCKGKRGWTDCTNKCRDCGKSGSDLSCKGRNPNKPLLTCQEVEW